MRQIKAETASGPIAFEAEDGKKLVLAIEDNGIDIMHRCGGNARCTTCRVEVLHGDPGPIEDAEAAILATKTDLNERTRLSCQIRIIDDLHIKVINQSTITGMDPGNRPVD
jgi:ferredoxin